MEIRQEEDFESMIFQRAQDQEINPAIIAYQFKMPIASPRWWWKPQDLDECTDVYATRVDLLAGRDDVLSNFVEAISASVQFPKSTAYLHGLGVLSAAMVESFFYKFNGSYSNTVALYTAGVQPPSTGKSGINEYLSDPIRECYNEKRKASGGVRLKIEKQIAGAQKAIKSAHHPNELDELAREIIKLEEELQKYPNYKFSSNDPTAEGCEKLVQRNGGFCNVISDEAAAIKVILGIVYGNGAGTGNNGIFLRLWDNGYMSVDRASRDGFEGRVRGTVCLLAQDTAVESILLAGQGGEGISERFLIIREKNLLGRRNHENYTPVSAVLIEDYRLLVQNIVDTVGPVYFTLTPEAERLVRAVKQEHEPLMADGAKFSASMLRGVVGKDDKQILKIASVLHCVENWKEGGARGTEIGIGSVIAAVSIFNQLLQTYVAAADSKGFSGEKTELKQIIEILVKRASKMELKSNFRNLRDTIKNKPQFNAENLTSKIKTDYLPNLEKLGYLVFDRETGDFYINPLLKG